jgi:hypothetical protein
MARYALCMGVDNYSLWQTPQWQNPNLPFSVKSAEDFAQLLIDGLGFEPANVTIQRDAWCTRGNILAGIAAILDRAQAGDVVCVYFCGHGGRIPGVAPGGEPEPDRFYEALLPYAGAVITDRELAALADRFEYDHVNFTLVLDTCHSGGLHVIEGAPHPVGMPLPEALNGMFLSACRTLVPVGLCLEHPRSDIAGNVRSIRFENGRFVIEAVDDSHFVSRAKSTVLSACAADQSVFHIHPLQSSILVGAFKEVINTSNFNASYADLLAELRIKADQLMSAHVRSFARFATRQSVPQLYGQRARMRENFLAPWKFSIEG